MVKYAGSLDTTVLLRLVLDDVPAQHAAAAQLVDGSKRPFAVSDTAVIELVFVLENHYHFSRQAIRETIDMLLSLPNIVADQQLFAEALPLFVTEKSLSFEECYLRSYSNVQEALPLWSFDKKLAKESLGVEIVPQD